MDQYGNIREYVWEYSGTCKGMCKVKNDCLPKILSNIFCQTKITLHNFIRQPGAMASFEKTVYHGPKKSHVYSNDMGYSPNINGRSLFSN